LNLNDIPFAVVVKAKPTAPDETGDLTKTISHAAGREIEGPRALTAALSYIEYAPPPVHAINFVRN